MRVFSLVIASFAVASLALTTSQPSFGVDKLAQLDNLENIGEMTTNILDGLGYDCETVAGVGLVCKKCSEESDSRIALTEKCTAYVCDAVTKKCRKNNAVLPKVPQQNRGSNFE
jgi:hypothetical protein